jgi:hypothetical protein
MNEPDILERLILVPKNLMIAVDEGSYLPLGQLVNDAALTIIRLRKQIEDLKGKENDRG